MQTLVRLNKSEEDLCVVSRGDFKDDQESTTGKHTVATAPLTPSADRYYRNNALNNGDKNNDNGLVLGEPFHDDNAVPASSSTLSSSASLDNHNNISRDDSKDDNPIPSSCSSPYQAFLFSSEWLGSGELQLPDISAGIGSPNNNNDDAESVASGAYFEPVDLDSSNWVKAIKMNGPTFGFAMVALATALVHPVLFVAGALTALGAVHAMGAGYDYCGHNSTAVGGTGTGDDNSNTPGTSNLSSSSSAVAATWEQYLLSVCHKELPADEGIIIQQQEPVIIIKALEDKPAEDVVAAAAKSTILVRAQPLVKETAVVAAAADAVEALGEIKNDVTTIQRNGGSHHNNSVPIAVQQPQPQTTSSKQQQIQISKEVVEQLYPPLDTTVVKDVSFPGLHAIEFFRVFFADDAPYNFLELQKQRGDLDIVYGNWEALGPNDSLALHDNCIKRPLPLPPPISATAADKKSKPSFQGRVLTFKAKTNNFIGPLYATTRKTQRVLLHHKTLVLMESRTDLKDIPFCDRFYVLERWIIRAHKVPQERQLQQGGNSSSSRNSGQKKFKYVSTLHATSQVVFTDSCQFAGQIKSKSAATIKDLVTCWCTMAIEALKLAEQRKTLRLQHELEQEVDSDLENDTDNDDDNDNENEDDVAVAEPPTTSSSAKENIPPPEEEEGIEVPLPNAADIKGKTGGNKSLLRPRLRKSGSLPLPSYRGRTLQGFKRSVSNLWNNNSSSSKR